MFIKGSNLSAYKGQNLLIGVYPAAYNIQLNSFFLKESNNTAIVKFNVSRKISSMGGPTLKKKKRKGAEDGWMGGKAILRIE